MSYQYTIDKRQIELIEGDRQGHYYIFWEDLPVGFIYRLDLGIDVGRTIWAGSTPFLNLHSEELGLYIQQCNI